MYNYNNKFKGVKMFKCNHCGKDNKEVAVFTKKILGLFNVKVQVCQSCISKVFRQFTKGV